MSVDKIAFVCPRYPAGATVGGAETLLKQLAVHAAEAGREVSFLTTCASNHFTWENERQPGIETHDGIEVRFFPVDEDRDLEVFLRVQDSISRGRRVSREEEMLWLGNSVNSSALYNHIKREGAEYDRIIAGPYLFGLTYFASLIAPEKTLLAPCLHDESFAYLGAIRDMFRSVRGFMFNTEPERDLAVRLYELESRDDTALSVVGMGLDEFGKTDSEGFMRKHSIETPYVLYCGRREPLKGTPLLLDYMAVFRARTGRDIALVLTGSGQVDVPAGLAGHVIDLGFVTETEKHAAMAGACAFCHPSVNESLGIVVLESWLAGRPCLVHASSEVLRWQCERSNAGLWFRSYPEFEEELIFLLDNPDCADALGRNGRDYVLDKYSWSSVTPRMIEALGA